MPSDEQQIRELVTTWIAATKAGDTQKVLSLMADDVVFLVTGRPPMIGKAAFAKALEGQTEEERPEFDGTSEIEEIQVHGDWAFMRTKLTVVVTPSGGGPTSKRAGYTLSILKKQDGKWVMARDANMLSPVDA